MTYTIIIETNEGFPKHRILNVEKRSQLDEEFNKFKANFDYVNEGKYYITSAFVLKIDEKGKAQICKYYK